MITERPIRTRVLIKRNSDGAVNEVFETWEKINPTETESEVEEKQG